MTVSRWVVWGWSMLLATPGPTQAAPSSGAVSSTPPVAASANDDVERLLVVPLQRGRLRLGDLIQVLGDEFGLDATALHVPDVDLDLRSAPGKLLLVASRRLLLGTTRCRFDPDADQLRVCIDRVRVRAVRRQLRSRLAALVARLGGGTAQLQPCTLDLPSSLDASRPVVVLVHGVEASAAMWSDLRAFLEAPERRLQVATFAYPNDASAERVAGELSARLRALGRQPVVLVGHSLGGLVARAVVEDPRLDPGNVRTLILTGVPNQGSNLAAGRFALEAAAVLREAGGWPSARGLAAATVDHFRDGLGEAGGDLFPGSVFLERLARRPRNPRVDYHLVLGTRSLLTASQASELRAAVKADLDGNKLARVIRPRLEQWLDDLDELQDGKGDGAVSLARGALPGVEPVLVPLDHVGLVRRRGLLGAIPPEVEHPVFALVAAWCALPR